MDLKDSDTQETFSVEGYRCHVRVNPKPLDRLVADSRFCSQPLYQFALELDGSASVDWCAKLLSCTGPLKTVLARTLEIDGRVMSFREPQVFVDLANAKAMCHRVSMESTQWSMITRFVLNQFQRAWHTREVSIIKLSNWANNLLFDWSQLSEPLRLVVVHMDLESYIIANLRGGRRRLEYSLNLLNHLTTASGKHRSVVAQVEASKADPFQQVLRHLATCYDLQQVLLFNAAQKMDRPQHVQWMTKSEIVDTPTVSVSRAARVFGLELDQETIEKAIARSLTNHAKSQWRDQFRISAETTANDQISKQYGDQIVAARRWHDQMFPG